MLCQKTHISRHKLNVPHSVIFLKKTRNVPLSRMVEIFAKKTRNVPLFRMAAIFAKKTRNVLLSKMAEIFVKKMRNVPLSRMAEIFAKKNVPRFLHGRFQPFWREVCSSSNRKREMRNGLTFQNIWWTYSSFTIHAQILKLRYLIKIFSPSFYAKI